MFISITSRCYRRFERSISLSVGRNPSPWLNIRSARTKLPYSRNYGRLIKIRFLQFKKIVFVEYFIRHILRSGRRSPNRLHEEPGESRVRRARRGSDHQSLPLFVRRALREGESCQEVRAVGRYAGMPDGPRNLPLSTLPPSPAYPLKIFPCQFRRDRRFLRWK